MTPSLRPQVLDALRAGGLEPADVLRVVCGALDEDLSFGPDVTTLSTVPADSRSTGDVVPRSVGVLAGVPVAAAVFDVVGGAEVGIALLAADGDRTEPGRAVLSVTGPTRALLTAERTALNLIGRLSGIATLTRRWVDEVEGTPATIRDTRKTTPGLRLLEKYAVRCGGGQNHRMALGDAALVKDNHVAASGGIAAAVERVRTTAPDVPLEVECDTLDQVREAVAAGVELVLLDNFSLPDTRAAVDLVRGTGVRLEASGGLSLDRAREVAATGVDHLAVGALTHSAPVLDLGFDLRCAVSPRVAVRLDEAPGSARHRRKPRFSTGRSRRMSTYGCLERAETAVRRHPAVMSAAVVSAGRGAPSRSRAPRTGRRSPAARRCSRHPACSAR